MATQVRNPICITIFTPTESQIEDWWSPVRQNKAYDKVKIFSIVLTLYLVDPWKG